MKIVIFSGPEASGKTTKALALQQSVSSNRERNFLILGMHLRNPDKIKSKAASGNYDTIVLDRNSIEETVHVAKMIHEAGFSGTFIATSTDPVNEEDFKGLCSSVNVNYLPNAFPGVWSSPNIKAEANRLAKEYDGLVLQCFENGNLVAYKVVFKDSQMTVIFKNRNGGVL